MWKLNKTSTGEPACFLLCTRCSDGDTLYYAKFTRLLTKLALMPYIYKKKRTAWGAERHPLYRCYWTLPTLLSLQKQGSINQDSYSWFNKAFLSRNTSLFTAIAVGGRSRRCSQLGATKYKLYSLVLLASEQIDYCTFMPYFMPCSGAFWLWWSCSSIILLTSLCNFLVRACH